MYLIQNINAHELALGDLRVTLRPKQRLDLDMICSRYNAEQSPSLSMAIKKGHIKILQKDNPFSSATRDTYGEPEPPKSDSVTKDELREMEKRMTDTLTAQLRKIADGKEPSASPSIDPGALSALGPLVEQLAKIVGGSKTEKPTEVAEEVDDKMVDIHSRSLDRMTKKTEGKIAHEEQTGKSDVADRANELEGLL